MLKGIETKANADILLVVKEQCSAVYHGDSFDDEKYNKLISYVQTAISWLHVCRTKLFTHICYNMIVHQETWLYTSLIIKNLMPDIRASW